MAQRHRMDDDITLIIDRRDSVVRMDGKAVRIDRPDEPFERLPLGLLGLVVVIGSPLVRCDVWRALAEHGVPAVLLSGRGLRAGAVLGATLGPGVELRQTQHRLARDSATTTEIARQLVAMKLEGYCRLLERLGRAPAAPTNASDGEPAHPAADTGAPRPISLRPHAPDPNRTRTLLETNRAHLSTAADIPAIRGIEGASAAAWFGWLTAALPAHWHFTGRNRRPPRDPINALLSLGYTLAGAEVGRQIQLEGLDPAVGFYHDVVPGRDALLLDLLEPLRPAVDALVLRLLDTWLEPSHFTTSKKDGCRLNKAGRGRFYPAWAKARAHWPDLYGLLHSEPQASAEAAPRTDSTSIQAHCRHMTQRLRGWLGAGAPTHDGANDDG